MLLVPYHAARLLWHCNMLNLNEHVSANDTSRSKGLQATAGKLQNTTSPAIIS